MSASILWETSYIIGFRLIWLSRSAGVNRIRFMSSPDRLAIVGVGHTEFGVIPEKSGTMLAVEAMRAAIADAGLRRSDIGGVVCQPGHGYGAAGEAVLRLGLPVNFYMDMQVGGATAILSIMCAAGAIAQGDADYVVSIYSTKARSAKVLVGGSQEETGSESVWGMFSPGARNAMRARHYLSKYDLGPETFWPVVSNQRGHANKRPDAMMHDRLIALEDYRDSPWVAEPFRRFDYCMMNDGAAAFVITTESRAADLPKKPVLVLGSGVAHAARRTTRGGTDYDSDLDAFIHDAREKAFGEAGVDRSGVDLAEFYDPFSIYPIMQIEAYGWCGPGEGSAFYRDGHGALGGTLPVNTHGGHLSWGYVQGYGPIIEGVRQLRGEGGDTQVSDANVVLVTGAGEGSAGSPAYGNLILGLV